MPASAIVVNNNLTPTQAVDPNNVTGVGQMVIDQRNGFIGLCTATLINPRTVIFAAHCVNENPAGTGFQAPGGYGAANGGLPIGFFFNVSNNAAGNSAISQWLNGVGGGSKYLSRTANNAFNSNWVWYNPDSTTLGISQNFLQGDIALASLDTPASKVPTWTLLFSPLASQQHVTIEGYGNNGTAATGSTGGIDFRRRVAENMVSLLGSLPDFETFLFGSSTSPKQNLYFVDFNDPKYGQAGASPFDFNALKDGPGLPREGTTASGDSGGPLVVDQAYSRPLIAGVLSGGYTRFFNGQPANGYGTVSFYQPLYLFWDQIVANNPYKYVGSLAGDAKWTDPTHWVINMDPNFVSLDASGNVVNALPTTAAAGVNGTSPKFGSVCFRTDCLNIVTGVETVNGVPVVGSAPAVVSTTQIAESETGLTTNGLAAAPGVMSIAQVSETASGVEPGPAVTGASEVQVSAEEFAAYKEAALALATAPTAANGLPGATNFVPNDTNGAPASNIPPRYYDVTLAAAGTTTLDTSITVDRLTLTGSSAALNVTSAGSLTSLIDTTVNAGTLNVDGAYTSVGDIALIGGLLSGSGTLNTGHLTSVLGAIAPGGLAKVGTLTVQGDVILSSGNRLYINFDSGNRASLLASQANASQGTTGIVNLGGLLSLTPANGYTPHYGDNYLVVSATGAVTGAFNAVTAISQGVLFPQVVTSAKAVNVLVQAASYNTVINAGSTVQKAYATLLDGSRPSYSKLSDLYGPLDVLPAASVQPTLETMAPFTGAQMRELESMGADTLSELHRERLEESRSGGDAPGSLAIIGRPIQLATLDEKYRAVGARSFSDAPSSGGGPASAMVLPTGINAFVAGGYLNGSGTALPSLVPGGAKNDLDGYYMALGGEISPVRSTSLGASLGYVSSSAGLLSLDQTHQTLTQFAVYGSHRFDNGVFLTGEGSFAGVRSKTRRQFVVGPTAFNLQGKAHGRTYDAEVQLGRDYVLKEAPKLVFTPVVGVRYQTFDPGAIRESGGGPALYIPGEDGHSLEGRLGLNVRGRYDLNGTLVIPRLNLAYVHDFDDSEGATFAAFNNGPLAPVSFGMVKRSQDWGEIGGSVTFKARDFDVSLGAKSNVGRKDVDFQTYSASVKFRF